MAKSKKFISRWGDPVADDHHYLNVPGYIMAYYHKFRHKDADKTGLQGRQFEFIGQIMTFKFDSSKGDARPGLSTIAERMGLSLKAVHNIKNQLVKMGALVIHSGKDKGETNIYSFAPLTQQCFRAALADGFFSEGYEEFYTGGVKNSTQGGMKNSTHEDIEGNLNKEKNTPSPDGDDAADTQKPDLTLAEVDEIVYQNGQPEESDKQTDSSLEKALDVATATPKPKGPREKSAQTNSDIAAARRNGSGGKKKPAIKRRALTHFRDDSGRNPFFDDIGRYCFGMTPGNKAEELAFKGRITPILKVLATWEHTRRVNGEPEFLVKPEDVTGFLKFWQEKVKKSKDLEMVQGTNSFMSNFQAWLKDRDEKQAVKKAAAEKEYVAETRIDELTGKEYTVMVEKEKS
ncbi:hypothetical protein GF380_04240 [Candidatus Uhrbacteria bacterium]|nr:hypothetical protein [Candidatus Uhrbacteria bacterium]